MSYWVVKMRTHIWVFFNHVQDGFRNLLFLVSTKLILSVCDLRWDYRLLSIYLFIWHYISIYMHVSLTFLTWWRCTFSYPLRVSVKKHPVLFWSVFSPVYHIIVNILQVLFRFEHLPMDPFYFIMTNPSPCSLVEPLYPYKRWYWT